MQRTFATGAAFACVGILCCGNASAAPGDLDTTFGSGGKLITPYGGPIIFDPKVAVQPDGKIVVAGRQFNGKNDDFVALRLLSSGTPDTSFGSSGVAQIDFARSEDTAKSVVFQADGKILLGGEGRSAGGTYGIHALTRLSANGIVDTTFGSAGKVVTDFGRPSHVHALAVQADGKILAIGEAYSTDDGGAAAVARYNSDGTLDSSFGTAGMVLQNIGSSANGHAILQQPDGKILIAGYTTNPTTTRSQFFVARLLSTGNLDTGFGTGGISQAAIGIGLNYCHSMQLQADGKILLAGGASVTATANHDFALARFNADGSADSSFGSAGIVTTEFSTTSTATVEEAAYAVVQPDGKIVAGGYSEKKFALARYLANGTLDSSFGSAGKLTLTMGGSDDFVKGLALQPDGKILASGYSKSAGNYLIAVARFLNDGSAAQPSYERIFNWGEAVLPTYFPRGASTQSNSGYLLRLYSTGYAVGTKSDRLYVYGTAFGGLLDLGPLSTWATQAYAAGF